MFRLSELVKATRGTLIKQGKVTSFSEVSTDSRVLSRDSIFVAIRGNNFDGHDFIGKAINKGASCVISERRIPISNSRVTCIKVKNTTKALGDIARFHRQKFDIPVIAVTGSNGKTTAKEMISSALSSKFKVLKNFGTENNHIGVPNTLLRLSAKHQAAVIELGTNHRGEISYLAGIVQPTIGVITNIGPSHLKYLKSLSGVYEEKISLLKHLKSPAIAILNADDQFLSRRLKPKPGIISLGVGLKQKTDFSASFLESADEEIKFRVNKGGALTLPLLGSFNVYNALLAIACGRILGLRYNDIARMLARFKPPEKRLNLVNLKGVSFINDCYNANPLSLGLALDVFNSFKACGRKIAVIGDMLELGSREKTFHIQAGRRLSGICDYLICVGKRSRFTAASAEKAGLSCDSIFTCESSSEAREVLFGKLSPVSGDVVLLKGSRAMKLEEVIR